MKYVSLLYILILKPFYLIFNVNICYPTLGYSIYHCIYNYYGLFCVRGNNKIGKLTFNLLGYYPVFQRY